MARHATIRTAASLSPHRKRALQLLQNGDLAGAEKLLRKEAKKSAQDPNIWMQLASIYGQQARFEDVVKCCEKVLLLNPQVASAHSLLGSALMHLGQQKQAISHLEQAVSLNPNDAGARNNLGSMLMHNGKLKEAARHLNGALELQPDNIQAKSNLANVLQSLGEMKQARQLFLEELKSQPESHAACVALGFIEKHEGHPAKAMEYFDQALNIKPGALAARSGKADTLCVIGKKEQAYDLIRQLIDDGKPTATALMVYATLCRDYGDCQEAIKLSEELKRSPNLSAVNQSILGFTLGKLYDSAREHDNAFRNYASGNANTPDYFDPEDYTDYINQIIHGSTGNARAYNISSKHFEEPVFIVGMPRSGTSLVEQILSRHSETHAAGELRDVAELVQGAHTRLGLNLAFPDFCRSLTAEQLDKLANAHMEKLCSYSADAKRITDKMPANYQFLGILSQIFPNASFVHCLRDPRDTCLSIYFQNFQGYQPYSNNLGYIAHVYNEYVRLMKFWESTLDVPILHLCYEDLVNNFETGARKLVEFTGLSWEDACLTFHESKRTVNTASNDQVRQPLYNSSIARWRHYEKHLGSVSKSLSDAINYFENHQKT